jgi:CBS domain-containing protein
MWGGRESWGRGPARRRTGADGPGVEDHRPWPGTGVQWRDVAMTVASPTHVVPRVDDLPLRPPVAIVEDARLDQAARIMRAHNISALVVGEPGERVSIVTERDLTQALADGRPPETAVGAIASADPMTVPPDATVMEVATLMLREGVRHLVVTRRDRAVGVVSMRDALTALVKAVTPDTVFVMLERMQVDAPGNWLG